MLQALAIVLDRPEQLSLTRLDLCLPEAGDIVVQTMWSGISTGTERLLYTGRMPPFPGMGYPLVPGYETVGRVAEAAPQTGLREGDLVFVPGARCFGAVNGLFGGAASHLVTQASRVTKVDSSLGDSAILLALAATALHARAGVLPGKGDLIVGHGVLGRLLARLSCLAGGEPPTVWEANAARRDRDPGYRIVAPEDDPRRDYETIFDVSGDAALLDTLIGRVVRGGEIVLAGFYDARLSFAFPPAFMRETRLRVAAEWRPEDLAAVKDLIESGRLSLDGLITHRLPASEAPHAYRTAFSDPSCLKMVLDWSTCT